MKRIITLIIIAILICICTAGCASQSAPEGSAAPQQTEGPLLLPEGSAPPPPEGKADGPFVRVGPAGEGEGSTDEYFFYTCAMQDVASYIKAAVRCRVDSINEYKFSAPEGTDCPDNYQSCYSCIVTESIYGDMKRGDTFNALDENCSYNLYEGAYKIEEGKEYILLLSEITQDGTGYSKPDSQIYDFRALTDYTLRSREFGVMAVESGEEYDTVTYRKGYGDFNGAAELNGTNILVGAEEQGYTAKYGIVKRNLERLISMEKAAEELSEDPDEPFDPMYGTMPYWPLDPAEKPLVAIDVDLGPDKDITPLDAIEGAVHIVRIKVNRLQDYALRNMFEYDPTFKEYGTLVHAVFVDRIASVEPDSSTQRGEVIAFAQYTSTYCPMPRKYKLEVGKEYVVILKHTGGDEDAMGLLTPYRLTDDVYSVMPIDDGGMVTYNDIFGDMGGKATHDGTLMLHDYEQTGYRASYQDVKKMFHDLISDL